jgi:hypothetical protein
VLKTPNAACLQLAQCRERHVEPSFRLGFDHIIALYYPSPTSYQIYKEIGCLYF